MKPPDDFAPKRHIDLEAWQAETEVMPVEQASIQARNNNRRFDTRPRSAEDFSKRLSPAGAGPIDEIATLIRSLTYGEMIELAGAMWKAKGEEEVTQATLPGILHRWSKK